MQLVYRRFIPNFSEIAIPLIRLTKKNVEFNWSAECQTAFDFLKESLTTVPVSAYPDPNKPYILYTDASDTCIGACLSQIDEETKEERPIYFLSHKLTTTQEKWPTIEKECFTIHYALQKLDHYLHNAEFVIRTDHKPLKYILDSPMQNRKVQVWALSIAAYNPTIEYIEGKKNVLADLLSKLPGQGESDEIDSGHISDPDIDDRTFEIGAINSNELPEWTAPTDKVIQDFPSQKELQIPGFDTQTEQCKDGSVLEIKKLLEQGNAPRSVSHNFVILDEILYYISNANDTPALRTYIPNHLRKLVIKQYHDENGHMGIDKTYDSIRIKYYWPNMYKELLEYVNSCVTCQTRNLTKIQPPLQETDIPPYPFAKVSVDLSGCYPKTLSGNEYIISFVDWYSGWCEAFPVPDKRSEHVVYLILEEIVPRYSTPLELVSDNGTENVSQIMKETLEALNIKHITTSVHHPQSNTKVERFHRTLHDVLSKCIAENYETWDQYLNQALAAIRFHENDSTKYSPFYLLYNRDPVLPLDNILKPRRQYLGEEPHQVGLEQMHKSFMTVYNHMRKAKKRQAKYTDKNAKDVTFQVGDPVYLKKHQRANKLQGKWIPYYRILEKRSPVTYIIRNQLDGSTLKTHAEHLRLANLEWETPKQDRNLRKARYAMPIESSSDSESESEDEIPVAKKIAKRYVKEKDGSSDEDDIPLMELAHRLYHKQNQSDSDEKSSHSDDESQGHSDEPMDINYVQTQPCSDRNKVKKLLKTIVGIL